MQEIELKFQVPEAARVAVARAVTTATARRTRLQALYYDTPDRRLAAAGIALRLRREGRQWVQTLKSGAPHGMRRLEHNAAVWAPARGVPTLDAARHDGTPAAAHLAAALAGLDPATALVECFRTDIVRIHRPLRVAGGAVELAFDTGRILAGGRTLRVCELEIELLRGSSAGVIDAARRWVARHGLWLDVRSKAERGDRLARRIDIPPAVRAGASPLAEARGDAPPLATLRRAAIAACLAQILPNASEIAGGAYEPAHVHQLRVGLRRLRSLQRFLREPGGVVPDAPTAPDATTDALRALFRALGETRDRDAVSAALWPQLRAVGAPRIALPAPVDVPDPAALLRAPAATAVWLDLLDAARPDRDDAATPHATGTDGAGDAEPSADRAPEGTAHLARRLTRWHRRAVADPKGFLEATDEARHALRKQVKRLRYAADFMAPRYPARAVSRYLSALRKAQERLGEFNDLCVADAAYRAAVAEDASAYFALGWIAARREPVLAACAVALARLGEVKPFWSKG